eukprot:TRINITY_DN8290_c0_g1_i1.p1 TRINITY_DN8290_c0_g1~~TRINITY_DN8290_c0_g1_i1.p1  ORF type:complete len:417 (-),score=98.41 TRINITY_DN8290_c0_g1_i1:43-1293(-)
MFAQSLSTLKKRTSQLGSQIGNQIGTQLSGQLGGQLFKTDEGKNSDFDDFGDFAGGASGGGAEDDAGYGGGPVLVRYIVQNGGPGERQANVFLLDEESIPGGRITLGVIRQNFSLQGKFQFRFKMPLAEQTFGGSHMWLDLTEDDEVVPVFGGCVSVKALQLPDDASERHFSTISSSAPSATPQRGNGVASPQFDVFNAGGACKRPSNGRKSDSRVSFDEGRDPSTPQRTTPVQPDAPHQATKPQEDFLLFDAGPGPSKAAAAVSSSPPPTPVKMPDRDDCIRKAQKTVDDRVASAAAAAVAVADRDEQIRKGKLEASARLSDHFDKWAKTSDKESWNDIRALLSTMHTVLWPESGWKPVSLSDLLAAGAIKKQYRKAILVVHPDRHQEEAPEKQFRAERIFQALNEAFKVSGEGQ